MARRLAHAAVALAVLASQRAAFAQAPPPAPDPAQPAAGAQPVPLPGEVQLDYLLASGQWNQLVAVLSRPMNSDDFGRALRWLRANIEFGGSSLLGLLYSRDLWAVGETAKVADPAKDLRVTAGLFTLYTYAVMQLAGARCEDQAAPSHRIQQLLDARKPTLDFIAHLSADIRGKAVASALALEQKSAPFRGNDSFVCRDDDVVAAGRPPVPGAAPPAPPPVKYADPAVAQPRDAKIRVGLQAALKRLVGL